MTELWERYEIRRPEAITERRRGKEPSWLDRLRADVYREAIDSWVPREWRVIACGRATMFLTTAARTAGSAPHPLGPARQAGDPDVTLAGLPAQLLALPARRTLRHTRHRPSLPAASSH
ncbi:hypothetical protein [Streptomyces sp. NBC_00286]|uniref:hypothetical protein n=1 Tax=Streptomyces sp. NBC_00286 TaxID=2975701 RepID=UPI002E2AF1E0|nr:hypothetical protein [Streptomyces sp. NBC_00286]